MIKIELKKGVLIAAALVGLVSCQDKKGSGTVTAPPITQLPPETIPSGDVPTKDPEIVLVEGNPIQVSIIDGIRYIPVEATLSRADYRLNEETILRNGMSRVEASQYREIRLNEITNTLKDTSSVILSKSYPEMGYFTALLPLEKYEGLAEVRLPANIKLAPISSIGDVALMDEDTGEPYDDPRSETAGF